MPARHAAIVTANALSMGRLRAREPLRLLQGRGLALVAAKHAPICRRGQADSGAKRMRQVALVDETDLLSNLGDGAGRPTQKFGRLIGSAPSQQFSWRTAPCSSEHPSEVYRMNADLRSHVTDAKTGCRGTIHDRFVCTRRPVGWGRGHE